MKKLIIGWMVVLVACAVFAGSGTKAPFFIEDCAANVTNSVTRVNRFDGRVDTVYIDVAAGATNTVTLSTATETILTATDVTTDTMYRPRVTTQTTTGVDNGVTNTAFFYLISDIVTVTVTSSDLGTNNVTVTLGVLDQ